MVETDARSRLMISGWRLARSRRVLPDGSLLEKSKSLTKQHLSRALLDAFSLLGFAGEAKKRGVKEARTLRFRKFA